MKHPFQCIVPGLYAAILSLALTLPGASPALAEPGTASVDGVWTEVESVSIPASFGGNQVPVRTFGLDQGALEEVMSRAPRTGTDAARRTSVVLTIPMPDGTYERFRIEESPVMAPELAAKFPGIDTFAGRGLDDPTLTTRFDRTPLGFHAVVLGPEGTIFVVPEMAADTGRYFSYRASDRAAAEFRCTVDALAKQAPEPITVNTPSGDNLRTYRLAVAATGEFTGFFGGSVANALAGIVTVVNNVNAVYNRDVAAHLSLVADNDDIIYTDAGSDPFPLSNKNAETQAAIDSEIGDANYDLGHLFHVEGSDISGNAGCIGCICTTGSKGSGWSQGPDPTNADYTFVVAHEMGHQIGGTHTFNGTGCNAGQYTGSSAWEPGSGSTIMSYSSICGSDNVLGSLAGDLYFHAGNRAQIVTNLASAGCGTVSPTGNGIPTVNAGLDRTIPRGTPFTLTATGNDPDNDPLTFCWEQLDLGPTAPLNAIDDGMIPLFRSFPPATSPSRTFPRLSDLLAGNLYPGTLGEQLPSTDRTLTFRATARDNTSGVGAADDDEVIITVLGAPFRVTSPNGGESLPDGCPVTVTWNVGGSTATNVNILYSTNGGTSFPVTLAANTANDGSQPVTIPCGATSQGRIRIEPVGNIYFDVSDDDFAVTTDGPTVACDITGGDVDENCEFLATFEGTVTDECSVLAADVDVTLSLPGGGATLGTPTVSKVQTNASTVTVTGSVLVSGLTGPPVTVRVRIDAEDGCGNSDFCQSDAQVADTTPPTIDVTLNRTALWPPNHKLSEIIASVIAEDNCDPSVDVRLTSIESNEPDNGLGDGDTADDIQGADFGTADLAFFLRSERSGTGTGRKYTIVYTAEDNSGNTATDTVCVRVPHSRSGMAAEIFSPAEKTYEPLKERFGLVVYGTSLMDVALIDPTEACLGNHVGAIRPSSTWVGDVDMDGRPDLTLTYDRKATAKLARVSTGEFPVGFHFTAGDRDYWIDTLQSLGLSVAGVDAEDVVGGQDPILPEDGASVDDGGIDATTSRGGLLTLPAAGHVRIEVFNIQGRKVRTMVDRTVSAGSLELGWDGRNDAGQPVPMGIYFYRIEAPDFREVMKVRIVR